MPVMDDPIVGTRKVLRWVITRVDNGALVDPSSVTIKVRDPAGAEVSYTGGQLTHPSTGVYGLNVDCPIPGKWYGRIAASGDYAGASELGWEIDRSMFAGD